MKTNGSRHVTSEYNFVLRDEELWIYGIASSNPASQKAELYLVIALKMLLCHWHCVATVVKLSALDYQKVHCLIYEFSIGIMGQVWYLIVLIPDLCTLTYFACCPKESNLVYTQHEVI